MPRYDYECPLCHKQMEVDMTIAEHETNEHNPICLAHGNRWVIMRKAITKMPLRTYSKRPQDRLWGTSYISSSERFGEKQRRKLDENKSSKD